MKYWIQINFNDLKLQEYLNIMRTGSIGRKYYRSRNDRDSLSKEKLVNELTLPL